ncbi:GNAT family N-acetyltransferase [Paenibacillus sp. GCM10023252]|uniref:GNAT family N-acetyltransferase n=1 Tax=Paenibacillus sp. GCM10023252 TaxID=3252649 RepID=UPI00361D6AD0
MLRDYESVEDVLAQPSFITNEVPYNLLHLIARSDEAVRVSSPRSELLLAQTAGNHAWLWMSDEISQDERAVRLQQLADHIKYMDLPGVTGAPSVAEPFAAAYARMKGLDYKVHMRMEAYHCPRVMKLEEAADGELKEAEPSDIPLIAEFLSGFARDALGLESEPSAELQHAEQAVARGGLNLWMSGGNVVSMANLAHRSPRHGRINMVYTPPALRKQGHASALVASLCEELLSEGLTPMLYADSSNPVSNKVYQEIGFIAAGNIVNLKFQP